MPKVCFGGETPKTTEIENKPKEHVTNLFLGERFLEHVGLYVGVSEEVSARSNFECNDTKTVEHFKKVAHLFGTDTIEAHRGKNHFYVLIEKFDVPKLMMKMVNGEGPINAKHNIEKILSEYLENTEPKAEPKKQLTRNPS